MEEVMLQNLTKTRAKSGCTGLAYVPRAFLQIFITTTLHHRLADLVGNHFGPPLVAVAVSVAVPKVLWDTLFLCFLGH
jgi:hypothetical protein